MYIETVESGIGFPEQRVSFKRKNTTRWKVQCVDYGASRSITNYSAVRQDVIHKQINYDLINGKLHIEDLKLLINPNGLKMKFDIEGIQHFPIMNTKLQVLRGEEASRVFDFKAIVTDPNSVSQIEVEKKQAVIRKLQELIQSKMPQQPQGGEGEEGEQVEQDPLIQQEMDKELQDLQDYFLYEWQDFREMRANTLLNHYWKELNLPLLFNKGIMDAMIVGEEIYQCTIEHGEPVIRKLNPSKVRIYKSGYSSNIEDADMIVIEDYLSKGQIIDMYYDVLTKKDYDYIMSDDKTVKDISDRGFFSSNFGDSSAAVPYVFRGDGEQLSIQDVDGLEPDFFAEDVDNTLLPYDINGNVRVCQVYWKTLRKVKKVKSYDPVTGEPQYNLMPEYYIPNEDKGEEVKEYWINEAWQGTKIGDNVFVNIGPCPVQYNTLSNPSKCHFGIIGSIYNLHDDAPFSLVDIMKPYNYAYDVVYDRLNKLIARNYGKVIRLDLSKIPNKWDVDKYMHLLKTAGVAVEDSFRAGNEGPAKGKLAGAMNSASSGVIDAELGNSIQYQIQLLEWIKSEMSKIVGVSEQREGQIQNRETVGGVERSVLQSSHITEWLFTIHDDVKRRVLTCLLETCKPCLRGTNKKFQYILSDLTQQIATIDGDEYCESDYGIVIDNSFGTQELVKNLPMLIQAGIQNGTASLSSAMKIYNAVSRAEKQKILENDEKKLREMQQQQQQAQIESQQQIAQMEQQYRMQQLELEQAMNTENNETKIIIANIQAQARLSQTADVDTDTSMSEADREKLEENKRQFNERLKLDKDRLSFDKSKAEKDAELKLKQINKPRGQ